jgi:hypothetical protein
LSTVVFWMESHSKGAFDTGERYQRPLPRESTPHSLVEMASSEVPGELARG